VVVSSCERALVSQQPTDTTETNLRTVRPLLDETHDPDAFSWIESANGHTDFPLQNLPLGVFAPLDGRPRGAVAIGDSILDLGALAQSGLLEGDALRAAEAAAGDCLNPLLALGAAPRRALRRSLFALLLRDSDAQDRIRRYLFATSDVTMHLPVRIRGYTDFYAGICHARNVGSMLRPENPLLPNYKHVPIGYHGRASSVRASGTDIRRPWGQLKGPSETEPRFAPTERLDYELELGIWIGAGNELGQPIPIAAANDHMAGFSLLNDWSARDIQAWEYQPLGPFLAKNFASTISPWIVTLEALAPFRVPPRARAAADPQTLPYLVDQADRVEGAYAIQLEVAVRSQQMVLQDLPAMYLGRTSAEALYWTMAQLVTHHASNGCNLEPGDLLGTGTISDEGSGAYGSILELTRGGADPVLLPTGERRAFLADGDEIIISGRAVTPGRQSIGFGTCRARILSASPPLA
jgi:fumarylacetoacetase